MFRHFRGCQELFYTQQLPCGVRLRRIVTTTSEQAFIQLSFHSQLFINLFSMSTAPKIRSKYRYERLDRQDEWVGAAAVVHSCTALLRTA